jgi:hypothetical protein
LLRERGILKGDNKYYVSTAIDDADVKQTIGIWGDAIAELRSH